MTLDDYMPTIGRPPIVAAVNLATALAARFRAACYPSHEEDNA